MAIRKTAQADDQPASEQPSTPPQSTEQSIQAIIFGRLGDELGASKETALSSVASAQVNVLTEDGESLVDPKGVKFAHGESDCTLTWTSKFVGSVCKVIVTSE